MSAGAAKKLNSTLVHTKNAIAQPQNYYYNYYCEEVVFVALLTTKVN